jgi:hypothetical protein
MRTPTAGHTRQARVVRRVRISARRSRTTELAEQSNVSHRRALAALALGEVVDVDDWEVLRAASMHLPEVTWLARMCEASAAGANRAASAPWGHLVTAAVAAARRGLADVYRALVIGRDPYTTAPPRLGIELESVDTGCLVCGLDRDRRWTVWEGRRRMLGLAGSRSTLGSLCVACDKARQGAAWPHEAVEACLRSALARPVAWECEASLHPVADYVFAARVLVARERGTRQPSPASVRFGWVDLTGPITRVLVSSHQRPRAGMDP